MATSLKEEPVPRTSRARDRAFWIAYLLAAFAIVLSYSSIFRPMWIDEAIHFVLSGQPTLGDLLLRLHNPDAGFLTRQTGFYQVVNYLTLQVTGANWVALRLPSILSAGLMIWAMYVFLRERGASRTFQFVGLIALAGQAGFMYYVGEARPYLPYAATTLGILAFLTANDQSQRRGSVKLLGWLSFFLGALFHLYFLLVLPIVLAYSVWFRFFTTNSRPMWGAIFRTLHVRLVGSSVALALVLGWLTWMRPQNTNQLDAFAWTGGNLTSLIDTVINFHLEFLPAPALRTSFMIVEAGLAIWLLITRKYRYNRELFASSLLILAAAATTVIIAASSVANSYAIANRQLVVGPLFIAVAFTWQLFIVTRSARALQLTRRDVTIGAGLGLVYGLLLLEVNIRIPTIPLSILIVGNLVALVVLAHDTLGKWIGPRPSVIVALVTALGLITAALSVSTRIAPRWQALGAFALGALLLLAAVRWQRSGKQLTLASVITAVVLASFGTAAISVTGSRVIVVNGEHSARAAFEEDIKTTGPSGISRLENLSTQEILALKVESGQSWVYLANINALRGGPVWPGLGGL